MQPRPSNASLVAVRALAAAALLLQSGLGTGCLLLNVGARSVETLALFFVGALLLVAGIRFLMAQMSRQHSSPWLRFAIGFAAALLIFTA